MKNLESKVDAGTPLPLLPCQYFDLIGRTSTGGLVNPSLRLNDKSHGSWFMILDNADDQSSYVRRFGKELVNDHKERVYLSEYLPSSSAEHGSILVTTRDSNLEIDLVDGQEPISITPFTLSEAVQLLKSKLAREFWVAAPAKQLLEVLECLPLAISQAAAFMQRSRM